MAGRRRGRSQTARKTAESAANSAAIERITLVGVMLLLVATLALVVFVRLRLADTPLERDEGEYAYAGQLILEGIPPYALAYNMKFPGTYYAYGALMALFGQTPWGIRAGLLCLHVLTMTLVFSLGRRIVGTLAAGAGTCAFALLALDRWSMGVFAHATHFVVLPVVGGLLLLHPGLKDGRAWRLVGAGVLMGIAISMKQQAIFFAPLAIGLAMWSARTASPDARRREAWRRAALVAGGLTLALAALVGILAAEGVLDRFWFWTFQYAAAYVSENTVSTGIAVFKMAWGYITQANAWLWYAALAGLALLFAARWAAGSRILLAGWLVAAGLSILPGFFFRPHYFIVLMPVAGLLVGVSLATVDRALARMMGNRAARVASLLIFALGAGWYVKHDAYYFFQMTQTELVRAVYETNPFLESPEIASYLNAHTTADDRIAVLGSEPQIFFYANRKSATGYIYTYSLMEQQPYAARMQEEMRREVEAARPRYLVFVGVANSWGTRPGADTRILTWASEYTAKCYEQVGIVDIAPAGPATIRWDADVAGYQPRFPSQVWTFRRRTTPDCQAQ